MRSDIESMRDLLRDTLGLTLRSLRVEDRLSAAWTVACGRAMAQHGSVATYVDGVVTIDVADSAWMHQMIFMRKTLEREMARIAGVSISAIHFELKKS